MAPLSSNEKCIVRPSMACNSPTRYSDTRNHILGGPDRFHDDDGDAVRESRAPPSLGAKARGQRAPLPSGDALSIWLYAAGGLDSNGHGFGVLSWHRY
jgi:hypothetical protein